MGSRPQGRPGCEQRRVQVSGLGGGRWVYCEAVKASCSRAVRGLLSVSTKNVCTPAGKHLKKCHVPERNKRLEAAGLLNIK